MNIAFIEYWKLQSTNKELDESERQAYLDLLRQYEPKDLAAYFEQV